MVLVVCFAEESPLQIQGTTRGPGEGEGALIALLSPSIDVLALTSLQLTSCPSEVLWHSAVLKHLSLSHNLLTTLPQAINSCCHLERLNLESNKLTVIPEAVFSLAALRVLQLSDNSIKVMPASIAHLSALRMLLVGNNQLQKLGPGIACVFLMFVWFELNIQCFVFFWNAEMLCGFLDAYGTCMTT